jgi:hypothetical protein
VGGSRAPSNVSFETHLIDPTRACADWGRAATAPVSVSPKQRHATAKDPKSAIRPSIDGQGKMALHYGHYR